VGAVAGGLLAYALQFVFGYDALFVIAAAFYVLAAALSKVR
jgi:hypothetical protein